MGIIKNKDGPQGFTTGLVLQGPDDTDALGSIKSTVALNDELQHFWGTES